MPKDIVSTAAEFIADLGLEAAKEQFREKVDERKLRTALLDYLRYQQKVNEVSALEEEIDFQGLSKWISQHFTDLIALRTFSPDRKERGRARDELAAAVVSYSHAEKSEAKRRVAKCISICMDIVRDFYRSQFSRKDYLLASEIVDAVADKVQASAAKTVAALENAQDALMVKIKETKNEMIAAMGNQGSLVSLDRAAVLAQAGDYSAIGGGVKKLLDHLSLDHPYYPDFGFDYRDGKLLSKPLTQEAKKLYPPRFVLTGAVRFGDRYYNDENGDPLDYSYRHQLPITMEVSKAIKLLGEKPDPSQAEAEGLVGNTVIATPPAFPPAFPCSIKVGSRTFFEYVLLRTQEIEDDGTYVIGNKEQDGPLYFEVRLNPNSPDKPDFKINMDHADNHELLNYVRFMDALSRGKDLHLYVLSAGEDIIAGYIDGLDYKTGFVSVEEEIDFLERVCAIEDYFDVRMDPYEEISIEQYEAVLHISDLIRKNEVTGTWNEAAFTGILDQHFREELVNLDTDMHMFSYVGVSHVELLGATFDYRFMRTYKCARMADYEKVKRKAEALDDGDEIKITFRAGKDNGTIDTLHIPEKIEGVS